MEATQPKLRTHCSVCGQKVVRQEMPYCIYCGNHFELMEGSEQKRKETRNMARLAKMPEHADYQAALDANPNEGPEFDRWRRRARSGVVLAFLGALLFGLRYAMGSDGYILLILGALLLAFGGWQSIVNIRLQHARKALPLMKRAVVVGDRRSETELRFNTGVTTYFFTFEFEDGNEAEFRFPGRGAHTEPLSKGVTGIAYTRGVELLDFRQLRV